MSSNNSRSGALPELLAPAGSPEALRAAVDAGADAVYFGAVGFNARAGARNFTDSELARAVEFCHGRGVRVYLTLNTLVYDREMKDYLAAAGRAYRAGVDALIVADIGGAAALRRTFPDLPLHASTQMSGHSVGAACIPHRNDKANAGARRDTHHCERPGIDLIIHGTGAGAKVEFFGLIGAKSENKPVDLTVRAAVVARRKKRKICIYGDG